MELNMGEKYCNDMRQAHLQNIYSQLYILLKININSEISRNNSIECVIFLNCTVVHPFEFECIVLSHVDH